MLVELKFLVEVQFTNKRIEFQSYDTQIIKTVNIKVFSNLVASRLVHILLHFSDKRISINQFTKKFTHIESNYVHNQFPYYLLIYII